MRKSSRLFVLSFSAVVLMFSGKISLACSVAYIPSAAQPCLVSMTDGSDPDSGVSLRVRTDWSRRAGYEFGFMSGDLFSAISSGRRDRALVSFDNGALVDFALRGRGADGVAGTQDDVLYRLSDASGSLFQTYSNPLRPRRTQINEDPVYRHLNLAWDMDMDGIAELSAMLRVQGGMRPRGSSDGVSPVPVSITPVPLPAAIWLLGSGILGLSVLVRRRRK